MDVQEISQWAQRLHQARMEKKSLSQISGQTRGPFETAEAYSIQELGVQMRIQSGEKIVGYKMGLTSAAKRAQMNLHSPLYGVLTDRMKIATERDFSIESLIHPKIEPEIAFRIHRDLHGKPTRDEVLSACDAVCACLEVLDSRYDHFKYFSLQDVIADNSSSSHFACGGWVSPESILDLKKLSMKMFVDEKLAEEGLSENISGDPVASVQQLVELLGERDQFLKAGSVVLAGAATTAVSLKPGLEIRLEVSELPSVRVKVAGDSGPQ